MRGGAENVARFGGGERPRRREGGEEDGRGKWVRFAPARGIVALCCVVLRRVASAGVRFTTESRRARREDGGVETRKSVGFCRIVSGSMAGDAVRITSSYITAWRCATASKLEANTAFSTRNRAFLWSRGVARRASRARTGLKLTAANDDSCRENKRVGWCAGRLGAGFFCGCGIGWYLRVSQSLTRAVRAARVVVINSE